MAYEVVTEKETIHISNATGVHQQYSFIIFHDDDQNDIIAFNKDVVKEWRVVEDPVTPARVTRKATISRTKRG